MQSIEDMRARKDMLYCAIERNRTETTFRLAAAIWLRREYHRYSRLIAAAVTADGQRRAQQERDGAAQRQASRLESETRRGEAEDDKPLSELGRMSDEEYKRSVDEMYLRKMEREDNNPRQSPGETW